MVSMHPPSASLEVTSISWKRAYTPVWHLIFSAASQGTPLAHLALVASGTYTYGSRGTVINGDILNQLPFLGHIKKQQNEVPSLSVKEVY